MALVSVLAFSVVNVLDVDDVTGLTEVVGAGVEGAGLGFAGVATGGVAAEDGDGGGFDPPILRDIVGAGRGASVCSGRSTGGGGG